jgi:secondary thiamine-phosphate synthase enzyme
MVERDMDLISVHTRNRSEFVDITSEVRNAVRKSGVEDGVCYLYVPHTTAGITINESADPSVTSDIQNTLSTLVPHGAGYAHREGNADSHVKATIAGCSQHLFVENGDVVLGTWQGVFFCEFDGPRNRKVYVKVLGF